MRTLKRLICACIAAAMLPICYYAADADAVSDEYDYSKAFVTAHAVPEDVVGTEFETAVSFLQGLDVYDDAQFLPWDTITRAEMVEYTVKTFNKTYVAASGVTYFADVPANASAAPYINAAVELGYIHGVGDRLFYPDDAALFEQAAKVLAIACGYNPSATYNGGFIDGYVNIAVTAGITRGINKGVSDELTRGEFAVMLYNALNADAMITDFDGNNITYQRGDSVLSEKFNIEEEKGILQATGNLSIYEDDSCSVGNVILGGEYYEAAGMMLDQYLGYEMEFYYDHSDPDNPVLVAARPTSRNTVYEIYSDDIEEDSTVSRISYYDANERVRRIDISLLADFVYNGLGMSAFSDEDILLKNGYLRTIDNNGDGNADVVIVWEYENYVVNAVDTDSEVIYDYYGKPELDLGQISDSFELYKDGTEMEFSALKKWDVLSIYMTKNTTGEKKARIDVSDTIVSGVVSAVSEDVYTIDGVQYKLAENLITAIEEGKEAAINVSAAYEFYIDAHGALAAINDGATSEFKYGLILRIYGDEAEDVAGVKLYTQDGVQENYSFPARFRYNGRKMDAITAVNDFNTSYENSSEKCKLVKYKLNSEGLVSDLYSYYGDDKNCIKRNIRYNETTSVTRNYSFMTESANKNLGGEDMYGISNNSILFNVPEEFATENDTGVYEEDDFSMVTIQDFSNSRDYKGTEIYDTDTEDRNIKVALVKIPTRTNFDPENKTICVNDKREIYDETQEEVIEVLEGYYNGQPVTLTAAELDLFKNVKAGDVIHAIRNTKGEITSLRVLFRPGDTQPTGADGPEFESIRNNGTRVNITQYTGRKQAIEVSEPKGIKSTMLTVFGTVVSSTNSGLVVSYNPDLSNPITYFQMSGSLSYYVCNIEKDGEVEYTVGTINDIVEGGSVFVQSRDGMHQDVYIIRYR